MALRAYDERADADTIGDLAAMSTELLSPQQTDRRPCPLDSIAS